MYEELISKVDDTLLSQTATWEEIRNLCDQAMQYATASVCIPPSYVKEVREYVTNNMKVCTVIGFPNGYHTTAVKLFETEDALKNGADEIDMVINLIDVKNGRWDAVREEIRTLKKVCGDHILKVIIEACLLTEEEKIRLCDIITEAGADFIKTSTGFSKSGASFEDVKLFAKHVGPDVSIKAAGGINSLEDAMEFIRLGAMRIGTSRLHLFLKH